ncbi:hypothetical protein JAO76_01225 [Pontibacter sp. BT310]|jgi:hypothetical protein|uniref:Uncharacterized protein n=1 Tax=Pontibacter populi TaxID=890055 RepID=A0ABS6X6M9_9BACT|nr:MULTISPECIES: hypothetical protein [Pontibacter]MBJ6116792.1 hypothetical protein [Pontibacter sp. BT310]MBR0569214.1 hypothetical protein [Microvirga sp. STS03]MBW3363645.1 hypothetical protein [Pontibacter populi]
MKSFYDFNTNSPEERSERNRLYPELASFHIALREELNEEEYQQFYKAEKEISQKYMHQNQNPKQQWITA